MNLPAIPKLPPAWVAVLTVAAGVLGVLEPQLPAGWQAVDGAVILLLAAFGVTATTSGMRAHGRAVARHLANNTEAAK